MVPHTYYPNEKKKEKKVKIYARGRTHCARSRDANVIVVYILQNLCFIK